MLPGADVFAWSGGRGLRTRDAGCRDRRDSGGRRERGGQERQQPDVPRHHVRPTAQHHRGSVPCHQGQRQFAHIRSSLRRQSCYQGFSPAGPSAKPLTSIDESGCGPDRGLVGSGTGAVARSGCRTRGLRSAGFPAGCATAVSMTSQCSVSSPRHLEPCVRFSRTRLTDAVHRRHSALPASTDSVWVWR